MTPAKSIGMVEVASIGNPLVDREEARILGEVLTTEDRAVPAVVTSSISQIGHTLGLSGMVSLIKAVVELEHGQVPRTPGMDQPLPEITSHADSLKVPQEQHPLYATLPQGRALAAVTNSGPNGAVYTMLIEGGQNLPAAPQRAAKAPTVVVGPTEWKTVRLGAVSLEAMKAEVAKWQGNAEPLFATGGIDHFNGRDNVRLAIVAENTQTLSKKLQLASDQLGQAPNGLLEQQGVYFRESGSRPKVAFLFPGQGSQYTGMLHDLVNESKAARDIVKELDAILIQHKAPRFADLAWTPNEQLGQDVFLTQLSMLIADTLVARVLMGEGLRPDVISSHSYGEFPALVAAGAMTFGDAIEITRERTNAVESRESTRGSLLSTTASLEVVERMLAQMPGGAYLASHNAPDQTVIGGTADAIQGVKRMLESEGFATRVLNVPRPYHTPLLAEAKPSFRASLERSAIQVPQLKFFSSVSLNYVSSADAVRNNLVEQLTTPVRYVQLIQQLAADGVNLFLEVGPHQVLTRLNQRILKDRPVSLISADLPKHTGREALERLHGLLETVGLWPVAPTAPTTPIAPGKVMFFDATTNRRGGGSAPARRVIAAVPAVREEHVEAIGSSFATTAATTAVAVAQAVQVAPAPVIVAMDRAAVQQFMINFVVDQTGYPAEMVELEADLEADLGIDSIKKAQLIGELAENFDMKHLADSLQDLSLDDFRTLNSLLDFVTKAPAGATPTVATVTDTKPQGVVETVVEQSAPVVTATVTVSTMDRGAVQQFMINFVVDQTGYPADMVEMEADLEADLGIDSIKKAQLIGELAENFDMKHLADSLQDLSLDDFRTLNSLLDFVTKTPAGASAAVIESTAEVVPETKPQVAAITAVPQPAAVTTTAVSTMDRGAVQQFMINFVVDQTGYPAEMVELEADLEADLGIDSIKKAQLIGELAENFDMKHLADSLQDLSLDDFRTLNSLLDFVTKTPAGATPTVATVTEAKPQAVVETVVEQPAPVAVATAAPTTVSTMDRGAVQQFMINFVVDQTGYPADMVEMEADLEADLGIDSIKKAQLIGELAENFDMKHLADSLQDLSLDDFRTLNSLLDFVTKTPAGTTPAVQAVTVAEPQAVVEQQPAAVVTETVEDTTITKLPDAFSVVPLTGSPYEMGFQHGRSQSAEIKQIMARYASMLGPRLQNIPELDEALAKPTMYFGEQELEELHGIADGAELPVPAVIAHNLGMYPDYVPGCTQFAYTRERNPVHGLVHAVNEDSPLSLTLPDCIARIVQVRRPANGIPHVTFSVAGQAGGLNGINAAGIAVSSTLLLDRPRRASTAVGKVHPVVVKRILEHSETIEDALTILRSIDRAGAWSLCISHHPTDRLCYVEYDGGTLQVQDGPKAVLTTNHCLLQPPIADVPEHSQHRLNRLNQLVGDGVSGVTLEMAQQALRDRYDLGRGRLTPHATMNTIRRVDNQISIVMRPEQGEIYVTPGPRSGEIIDKYFRLDLNELFSHNEPSDGMEEAARTASSPAPVVSRPSRAAQAEARAGLPAEEQRIVQRHVLRMEDAPLPAGAATKPAWTGAAAILGDNKLSESLRTRLQADGVKVHTLPGKGDVDAAVAALNAAWSEGPIHHVFVTTARDDGSAIASVDGWQERRQIGAVTPFFVLQRWTQLLQEAKALKSATMVGVTALGGDFGFCGRVHGCEGGGITGLFKGIRRELPDMLVKVIDAPFEEAPAALVDAIYKEVSHRQGPLEVGWVRGHRSIVKAIPQPASTQRLGGKTPHGVWVVTGGARGVTAVVARELGRRFGLTMHLLGSTTQPTIDPSWRNLTEEGLKALKRTVMDQARAAGKNPANTWKDTERAIEIDRTLQSFRADGIDVHYHACDVADRTKLGATLDAIRKASGPINGIIHGAGLEAACKFEKKKRELVEATIKVKMDAGLAMLELTQLDPLDWFVGFGSTSGRFGGMGQADYSMAQDMLCKMCDWVRVRRPEVSAVGMHWPPWADVGMAARPESKIALQSSNLAFMPPLEGAAHVIDELLTEALEGEVLYLDKPDMIDTDGTMPDAATKAEYKRRDPLVKALPLIETISSLTPTRVIGKALFDPAVEPFLLEHRYQGVPILPAVVGLESMAESATLLAADDRKVVGVRKMTVHQGFRFHLPRPQRARAIADAKDGAYACRLEADFFDRVGRLVEAHRLQMDATLDLAATYPQLPAVDLGAQPTEWKKHQYVTDWRTMKFPEEARVYHGYCFQALTDYAMTS
ncbi:MAG TPA: C45 family autoproteolytic acyltransferase/hydrolase, partial [Planctomycetaceae bacterium]|nr:C45 family autoproteolytic acyltransferase/hydrolase [Planctomycetaceae bacterium]